jgi:hypothetical protein
VLGRRLVPDSKTPIFRTRATSTQLQAVAGEGLQPSSMVLIVGRQAEREVIARVITSTDRDDDVLPAIDGVRHG